MGKISIITIVKEVKNVHPEDVVLIRTGEFYRIYGKDAYIISNLFEYKIKKEQDIMTCGFPSKSLKKIEAKLEQKKINYLLLDSKDNYTVNERMDFKNLNTYQKQYELSKIYVNNQIRIEKIYAILIQNARKEELKFLLKEIEEKIYANRKIQSN